MSGTLVEGLRGRNPVERFPRFEPYRESRSPWYSPLKARDEMSGFMESIV